MSPPEVVIQLVSGGTCLCCFERASQVILRAIRIKSHHSRANVLHIEHAPEHVRDLFKYILLVPIPRVSDSAGSWVQSGNFICSTFLNEADAAASGTTL